MRYRTITELSKALLPNMLDSTKGIAKSNAYHVFNNIFESKTCSYDLNLGLITGHTKSRWTRLINQYVDKKKMVNFVSLSQKLDTQCSTTMLFKGVASKKLDHQYGNCLLAVCYCDHTLTLFSRTCYAGYMGYIDLALVHKIAEKIGNVKGIKFRWCVVDLQVSYLKSLQIIMLNKELNKKLIYLSKHPSQLTKEAISWQRTVGVYKRRFLYHYQKSGLNILNEAKYGPVKRYIKKWLMLQGKVEGNYPKSLTLKELEL